MSKTYANLKADIASWTHRDDLTSQIATFTYLAEQDIYRSHANSLRVREMETEATITITSGIGPLPTDFLQARYLRIVGNPDKTYKWMPPQDWTVFQDGFFTVIGSDIHLPNSATGVCKLVYCAMPAALASDADTNTILTNYYAAYLYAALKQAYIFVRNGEEAMRYTAMLDNELAMANQHNRQTVAGPLVVRAE